MKRSLLFARGQFLAVAALVGGAILGGPGVASSVEPSVGAEEHCAVQVFDVALEAASDHPVVCFATEEEAIAFASQSFGRGVQQTSVLGTIYSETYLAGSSLTFWGEGTCAGNTFGFSSLSSSWVKDIRSIKAAGSCWVTLYTASGYGGNTLNCTPYCNTIGSWAGNTRSLVFRPTGTFG